MQNPVSLGQDGVEWVGASPGAARFLRGRRSAATLKLLESPRW